MIQKPIFSFLIFMLQSISQKRSTYNFKKCTDEMNYKYFYFYLQTLKMGANDASGEGLQYATRNRHQNKFPESYDELTMVF
jgi:hypothetical protein